MSTATADLKFLTNNLVLAGLLGTLRTTFGGYQIVEHWKQGEFHHDLVLKLACKKQDLPGDILVVSTNCNGGVKELLCFDQVPDRWALWHHRCPNIPEFEGSLPAIPGAARTPNWYDPCGLLGEDGPSELKPEFRERLRVTSRKWCCRRDSATWRRTRGSGRYCLDGAVKSNWKIVLIPWQTKSWGPSVWRWGCSASPSPVTCATAHSSRAHPPSRSLRAKSRSQRLAARCVWRLDSGELPWSGCALPIGHLT